MIDGIVDGIGAVVAMLIECGGGFVVGEEVCCLSREQNWLPNKPRDHLLWYRWTSTSSHEKTPCLKRAIV